MDAVNFHSVSKWYGAQQAIRDIDFAVQEGEFLVIVGPSGCGKSSVLRMIAGLEQPTAGEVWIGGEDAKGRSPGERNIGMVFQNYALYPHLSVFENLAFSLRAARMPKKKIQDLVKQVAVLLELEEMLAKRPGELSGGQKQRVALGRALVRQPDLFLMDEPLSNLDAILREKMRMDLRNLHEQMRIATVYVTHDQVEAMTMADRILVMQKGEIHQIGTPHDIYHQPATLFVARFFGSPPMNTLQVNIHAYADKWEISSIHHEQTTKIKNFGVWESELRNKVGDSGCWIGFRPESIQVGQKEGITFRVIVTQIETLGARAHVHARWGNDLLIYHLTQEQAIPDRGETVWLTVPLSALHWFDEQQRRLHFETAVTIEEPPIRQAVTMANRREA